MTDSTFLRDLIAEFPVLSEVIEAAANNDLYRINEPEPGELRRWRHRDGTPIPRGFVIRAMIRGALGYLAPPEQMPDGTWASRAPLADTVMDEYTTHLASAAVKQ